MAISEVSIEAQAPLIERLSKVVDFEQDLPLSVFKKTEFVFWFFERPLFSFVDLCSGVLSYSACSFKDEIFIKFSGDQVIRCR